MASADDYAAWIVRNADKKGTPEFATVAAAYQQAKMDVPQPKEDPGFLQSAAISAGNWVDSKAAGLRGAVRDYVPGGQSIVSALDKFDTMRGVQPPTEQTRSAAAPAMQALEQQRPGATMLGSFAPDMLAKTPLGMATLAGLDPGTAMDRAERAGIALGGGIAGQYLGRGVGKLIGRESMAPAGNAFDIPLTAGQATQYKPLQIAESVLANMPVAGGVINKARDNTFTAFNKAIGRTIGEDSGQLTPEVLGAAKSRIGGTIGDVAERNSLQATEPFFQGVLGVAERANKELVPDQANLVKQWTNNIIRDIDISNPDKLQMTGQIYKAYDSKLGALSRESTGTIKSVWGDLRGVLRDAMDKSISPEDAATWAKARKEYLNLQSVADAAKNTGDGAISPARLLQSVNSKQANAKFGSGTDLADLAQWAKGTLPDKIPNSGTAQRLLYQKILTSPVTSIGALAGAGYGADRAGVGPGTAAAGVAMPYVIARALAGKPASRETEELLKRLGGGLLSAGALQYAR